MLQELALDIWREIIYINQLDIADVINVSQVNKQLYHLFRRSDIWYALLMRDYLDVLLAYRLESAKTLQSECLENNTLAFHVAQRFHRKELYFNSFLKSRPPMSSFLDNFVEDTDYLLIAFRKYYLGDDIQYASLKDGFDLQAKSICHNLLLAQTFNIGFKLVTQILQDHARGEDPSIREHEQLWFYASLLDEANHQLVFAQKNVYHEIYKALNSVIREDHLNLGFEMGSNEIIFKDLYTFSNFMIKMMETCANTRPRLRFPKVAIKDVEQLFSGTYYESFSLFRSLTGNCTGDKIPFNIIILKAIDDVLFSKYTVKDTSGRCYSLPFLDHYGNLSDKYFDYFFDDEAMMNFLSEFAGPKLFESKSTLDEMLRYYAEYPDPLSSMYDCLDTDTQLLSETRITSIRDQECIYNRMTNGEIQFIQAILSFILKEVIDPNFGAFTYHEEEMITLSNAFHSRSLPPNYWHVRRARERRMEGGVWDSEILPVEFSYQSFVRRYPFYQFSKINDTNYDGSSIVSGSIVYTRHNEIGIVLGYSPSHYKCSRGKEHYIMVYTSQKAIARYRITGLTLINPKKENFLDILRYLIQSCCLSKLGVLLFTRVQDSNGIPRFHINDDAIRCEYKRF